MNKAKALRVFYGEVKMAIDDAESSYCIAECPDRENIDCFDCAVQRIKGALKELKQSTKPRYTAK